MNNQVNNQAKDDLVFQVKTLRDKVDRYFMEEYTKKEKTIFKRYLDERYPTYRRGWGDREYRASDILESLDPSLFKREMDEYYEEESIVLEKKIAELESELNNIRLIN